MAKEFIDETEPESVADGGQEGNLVQLAVPPHLNNEYVSVGTQTENEIGQPDRLPVADGSRPRTRDQDDAEAKPDTTLKQPPKSGASPEKMTTKKRPMSTGTKVAIGIGSAVVCGAALVVAAPLAIAAAGFGSAGVVAGSVAAAWQSSIGAVAAGSIFASLQSAGAAGLAVGTQCVIGAAGAAAGGGIVGGVAAAKGKREQKKSSASTDTAANEAGGKGASNESNESSLGDDSGNVLLDPDNDIAGIVPGAENPLPQRCHASQQVSEVELLRELLNKAYQNKL